MAEYIIGDDNAYKFVNDDSGGRGMIPRDYEKVPFGSMPFAAKFDLPVIDRSKWSQLIDSMTQNKTRLSDVVRRSGMKSLNQERTNFCWSNGPVNCVRITRLVMGAPHVDLSPASVACPINGFVNKGGWGTEALARIVSHGVTNTKFWPANAIDRKYFTDESKQDALLHRVTEWYDLQPRNFGQLMTCLFLGFPVAVGYNWWGHEVTALDPVEISPGKFGVRIYNSWGDDWEDGGMSVLTESKATPDDAVAPRVVIGSLE